MKILKAIPYIFVSNRLDFQYYAKNVKSYLTNFGQILEVSTQFEISVKVPFQSSTDLIVFLHVTDFYRLEYV